MSLPSIQSLGEGPEALRTPPLPVARSSRRRPSRRPCKRASLSVPLLCHFTAL